MTVSPPINEQYRYPTNSAAIPTRWLFGPGPCNAHPRVLAAMSLPLIGHLDPDFLKVMDENQALLRYAWQTDNAMTIAISGTGSAAMEATLANIIEPGDRVLVGVKGYFGHRLVDMAQRYRAEVHTIHKPWGEVFSYTEIKAALETHRPKILTLVHAETSTGVCQPLEGIGALCHQYDCLLLIDTVTSLGAVPVFLDEWQVDLAYSCSQKGLGCSPGASPFTMSERAREKRQRRQGKVPNWYLDESLLSQYWGAERIYHHTAPISLYYGLREALTLVAEEGLAHRWQRHRQNSEMLWQGLTELGLTCHVPASYRLVSLTTVRVPDGVDAKAIATQLRVEYNIEIGLGLGDLAGKVWRIGLMGYNSRPECVLLLLKALQRVLKA